ncbi:MAG: hypothetical protein RSB67_03190 [Clostridia bacterium]
MLEMLEKYFIQGYKLNCSYDEKEKLYKVGLIYIPHLKACVKGIYGSGSSVCEAISKLNIGFTKSIIKNIYPGIDKYLLQFGSKFIIEYDNNLFYGKSFFGNEKFCFATESLGMLFDTVNNQLLNELLKVDIVRDEEKLLKENIKRA